MDDMRYVSTRGNGGRVTASQAILQGIAGDGGLFAPERLPRLGAPLSALAAMSYADTAYEVMRHFLTDYTEEELRGCISGAYDEKFGDPEIAPLAHKAGAHFLELFHGPTLAFKDMALTILPRLMKTAAEKNGLKEKIVILVSTSGDTGKAALEGFANVPGVAIMVLYPKGGVSAVQELQMTTQEGANTGVLGILGNFDDCQTTMKQILTDPAVAAELSARGAVFSSANSINAGRLLPQVAYYAFAYGRMVKDGYITAGQPLNFTVPTGNFGNILAAYYAKRMGLPIGKLICASNSNNVLADFLSTGRYNKKRPFVTTMSPSMDILISSNLERLLYHLCNDAGEIRRVMGELNEGGAFSFTPPAEEFYGNWVSEEETLAALGRAFANGHTMDTHTAVAYAVYEKYRAETGDDTPNVIAATASPFKFARAVCRGIGVDEGLIAASTDFELIQVLSERSGLPVPKGIAGLDKKPVRHTACCAKEDAVRHVLEFLGTSG